MSNGRYMRENDFDKWLEKHACLGETLLVRIQQKYDCDKEYEDLSALLEIEEDKGKIIGVWDWDWWEGQEDVKFVGCMPIKEVEIPMGHFSC